MAVNSTIKRKTASGYDEIHPKTNTAQVDGLSTALANVTISGLDDIGDVAVSSASSGDFLKYDGTNWVPGTASGADGNDYLDGITKSSNTLTFSVGSQSDVSYTFGSNAFNSTTIPTNNNQLTNGAGYITSFTNNYLTGVSGSGDGTVTFTRSGLSNLTWDASHSHSEYLLTTAKAADANLLDGLDSAYYKNDTHTVHTASDLAVGWYTIATNTGDRAIARFGLKDADSGRHQSVVFYAAHHFGNNASNTLTVLHESSFGTTPFRYIRIKDGGTYDGAALQVYIDNAQNNVSVFLLGDNFQASGWVLKDWVGDAIDPGDLTNYSSFGERGKIDLDNIAQGGMATTGEIYAGGDTTQYKVWHAGNDGASSGLDADTLDTYQASQFVRSDANDTMTGDLTISNTQPRLILTDTNNNSDFHLQNHNGIFTIGDTTNQEDRFEIDSSGNVDILSGDLTVNGGLTIEGSINSGGYEGASEYEAAGTNIILKGDSEGRSGIFFQSEKDGTNINHTSDFGFIQFHPYGRDGTSGEANELIIGVSNDSTDHLILNAPASTGIRARIGATATEYVMWHSGNDGSGSGLDADKLDNQEGSYYAPKASPAFTGIPTAPTTATSDNSTKIATTAYVKSNISDLIGGAPDALNTLNELAAALADDENYASTITTALGTKVAKSGGNTISGNQNFYGTDTSGTYSNAPIEIREVNLVTTNQSSEAYAPELAFHWGGRSQTSIWMNASGKLNLAGNQTGQVLTTNEGNAVSSSKWSTARTITLGGDLTGNVSIDGSANVTLTAAVVDDSHNHIISNIDGLQSALDLKAPASSLANYVQKNTGYIWTGIGGSALSFRSADTIDTSTGDQAALEVYQDTAGADAFMQFHISGDYAKYFGLHGGINDFVVGGWSHGASYQRVFHDGYHPNADKWTTARTLSLTGAVTGSVSWDGSGNASLATTATADPTLTLAGDASGSATFTNLGNATLTVTVANDSHTHDGRYYTETEVNTLLAGKAASSHNHSATEIVTGELNTARMGSGTATSGYVLKSDGDGTASWQQDNNTTYSLGSFGVTATAAELNKMDGVTATTTELNYTDGVTSNIQTQLNGKLSTSAAAAAVTYVTSCPTSTNSTGMKVYVGSTDCSTKYTGWLYIIT